LKSRLDTAEKEVASLKADPPVASTPAPVSGETNVTDSEQSELRVQIEKLKKEIEEYQSTKKTDDEVSLPSLKRGSLSHAL
jgi:hypothetical protein